jgi:hypothetical protein
MNVAASVDAQSYFSVVPINPPAPQAVSPGTPPGTPPSAPVVLSLAAVPAQTLEVGQPYNLDLSALLSISGPSGTSASNVTWGITSGALPMGLALSSGGVISGTPSQATPIGSLTVQTVYPDGTPSEPQAAQTYSFEVRVPLVLSLASATLPGGQANQAYAYNFAPLFSYTGQPDAGAGAAVFSLASGVLPAGLTFSGSSIIGTPVAAADQTPLQLRVDYSGKSFTQSYLLPAVQPAPLTWTAKSVTENIGYICGSPQVVGIAYHYEYQWSDGHVTVSSSKLQCPASTPSTPTYPNYVY